MNSEFLDFINNLIQANPELANSLMTENIEKCLNMLAEAPEKPALTENGKMILKFLQESIPEGPFKASDVATGLGVSARGASGALRKLVTDGFCDKVGKELIVYTLTEKGRNFIIED